MFELEKFIEDCKAALGETSRIAVRDVVARAVANPAALIKTLGEPTGAGIKMLYCSPELSIFNLVWGPGQMTTPHNHHMWAAIGMYGGREDNIYWRKTDTAPGLQAAAARSLGVSDCELLGAELIHSVINPLSKLTGAIHVYGGDLVAAEREEWEAETLRMQRYDGRKTAQAFEAANLRWQQVTQQA